MQPVEVLSVINSSNIKKKSSIDQIEKNENPGETKAQIIYKPDPQEKKGPELSKKMNSFNQKSKSKKLCVLPSKRTSS